MTDRRTTTHDRLATRLLAARLLAARLLAAVALATLALALTGCFVARPNAGGAQTSAKDVRAEAKQTGQRSVNPADVAMPAGYQIEPVATGLTYPTGVAFDDRGRAYVVEAGYSYGEDFTVPRLLRIEPNGSAAEVARGSVDARWMSNGPWSGVAFHNGGFYVCEGGARDGGRVLRIDRDSGRVDVLLDKLPSMGDHQLNGPIVRDGYLYFGIGTATNSGVVGPDNAKYGWLKRAPTYHDIPAKDIKLAGRNFESDNPLTPDAGDKATTGAYVPFGTPTQPGQVIKGQLPCNGAVLRVKLVGAPATPAASTTPAAAEGSGTTRPADGAPAALASDAIELVAWGLRNPFGLAFAPDGRLFVTEHSYDVRGSRPVWGTGDLLWAVDPSRPGLWHGWPDYFAGERMEDNPGHYRAPGEPPPKSPLAEVPNDPPRPTEWFGDHSGSSGVDVATADRFGHRGDAFVAQFGDLTPGVGKVLAPVGFKVVHVNVRDGVIYDFAVNRGKQNGPASKLGHGGLERPVAVRFDPSGDALYVVDFGVLTTDAAGKEHPVRNTGVLWRVTRPTPAGGE